ncbi:unnamed protein product [Thlaspi arvense]|uniref:RING-type E3 ubiquitin transferase n=1 Tax=Thlaspi arvense TaxID=13288 RepID=A0AAU9SGY1_THLAR|nr:unnamed protein product [Thlaspi arvense]
MTTISPRRDSGGRASDCRSSKKQRLPSVSEEESSDDSSSGEEESDDDDSSSGEETEVEFQNGSSESRERELVVLSDDSDSEDEKTYAELLRSRRPRRLSPPKSLTLPDSDVLDCPNCFEPLRKPIFQCNNGHLACSACCTKLKKRCFFCALPTGDIRCRAMEKVIKTCVVSCPNAKHGCKQITTYGKEESSHAKLCLFTPCSCPVLDCNYIGSYKDLNNHFRITHKKSPGEIMSIEFGRQEIFRLDFNDDPVVFQMEKEGDLIVIQGFKGSHGVYASVSRIAPVVPVMGQLYCSIARLKENSTLRLEFMVKNVQKVREKQEQPEDSFLLIPTHMLRGDHLKMQICIRREYVPS